MDNRLENLITVREAVIVFFFKYIAILLHNSLLKVASSTLL